MSAHTRGPAAPAAERVDYASEVRFGVVMYGGVSLAIYINGVANEMFEMACATPKLELPHRRPRVISTRDIYRRLSFLAGNAELRRQYAEALEAKANDVNAWDVLQLEGAPRTRLVVDVISGTSAGGINGIFLAKALANGEQFAPLKNLWIQEGDLGLLLNDRRSYETLGPSILDRSDTPASLLNSDRMYVKLLEAMQQMKKLEELARRDGESPLVDEIDLFVTTTDIVGAAVPLRLFNQVVYERRHKQSYHFSYPDGLKPGRSDFDADNDAFLAFAARCTSSFPFAFEPMTLAAVTRLTGTKSEDTRRWDGFFPDLPKREVAEGAHVDRAFGDGGYLDNKPFSYAVQTLCTRQASVPIERKLIYVEPSPEERDGRTPPGKGGPPDAISNAAAALTSIPQYETIREDLQAVLQRNRRIERVERIVRLGEVDIERASDPFAGVSKEGGRIPVWSTRRLSQMVQYYGLAFLPYRRLRVFSVTDKLADRLADLWDVDRESDQLYALRALVRVWRDSNYDEEAEEGDSKETINAFLNQFDLDYRLRRLNFLLRKTDQATRLIRRHRARALTGAPPLILSDFDKQVTATLQKWGYDLNTSPETPVMDRGLRALHVLKTELLNARAAFRAADRQFRRSAPDNLLSGGMREQLEQVLLLVLGQRPEGSEVLELPTVTGKSVPVTLAPGLFKAASASSTLQESVVIRARALFDAAGQEGSTQLQDKLESTLERMRMKRRDGQADGAVPAAEAINARASSLLGRPRLEVTTGTEPRVIIQIGKATARQGEDTLNASDLDALNNTEGTQLRHYLADYYLRFESFDQMSFPLYYDTGTGEPSTVEVVRISPRDTPNLIDEANGLEKRRKLAGTAVFAFGAFLDERWRRNDIMWGRLDGAERIVETVLPASDPTTATVRRTLIEDLHGIILREELVGDGHSDITDLLCTALRTMPGGTPEQRLQELLTELRLGDRMERDRLTGVLVSLLSESGLIKYVRERRDVDRTPDPKSTFDTIARATTITGRMLDVISKQRGQDSAMPRWLARLGLALQGLVAVSLPGTLTHRWWTHGMKVLYAIELVLLTFAMLFGNADARSFVLSGVGVTVTLHLLSLLTGDAMREKAGWLRAVLWSCVAIVVTLAIIGVLGLRNVGWTAVLGAQ